MLRRDLLKKYYHLLEVKKLINLDGIGSASNKSELENGINCLECTDSQLDEYAIIIKLKYPNTFKKIIENPVDWKRHPFNRLYIWNTARLILG